MWERLWAKFPPRPPFAISYDAMFSSVVLRLQTWTNVQQASVVENIDYLSPLGESSIPLIDSLSILCVFKVSKLHR